MYQDKFTVKLGDYKNLTCPQLDGAATEEEIAQVIENELQKHAVKVTVDAPAQNGDIVVIDFAGFLGDEQFEGGTSENYSLQLGSGSFIPGFEEQLIGSKAGDEVDVNVTFPENYHAENLAGKPVVFKCKVHAVQQQKKSELNDAFVQKTYNMPDVNALKVVIRTNIEGQKAQRNKSRVRDAVMKQLIERSEVTVTDAYLEGCSRELMAFFQQNLAGQGMTLEMYCQYSGATPEMLMETLRPQAMDRAKASAVLVAVAEAEGLTVTEEEFAEELQAMADSYQMEVEQLREKVDEAAKRSITMNMLITRAMELVVNNALAG